MRNFRWWLVFSNALLMSQSALAAVNTEVTRVVFNAGDERYSLGLANSLQQPALVQVWTDKGDPSSQPDSVITPVVAVPPVFKMQPGELRSVTLRLTGASELPRDREALYWLNIYQIPPLTERDALTAQKIVLPLRIRMKVFIRPRGVSVLQESDGTALRFAWSTSLKQLHISNPTPWHFTFDGLSCEAGSASGVMIAPRSSLTLPLAGRNPPCTTVAYDIINDAGNHWSYTQPATITP